MQSRLYGARGLALAILTGLALSVPLAPGAGAQEKTFDLKLSHWVPPSHPLQKALEDWGASIEKASNGTIKYKVYPSSSSARRSTITTWRATASPTLPISTQGISPAASRSSAPASCRS